MQYFDKAFLDFFRQLARNNNADWFKPRKAEYEAVVKKPFERFVADLLPAVAAIDPTYSPLAPKDCIHRIYRDVRFSNDKTPYKTHASAWLGMGGKKSHLPGFYVHFSPEETFFAAGSYDPDSPTLYRIRQEIVYNAKEWDKATGSKEFQQLWGSVQGAQLKTAPRDFKEEAEAQPILKHKQFYVAARIDAKYILSDGLMDAVLAHFKAAVPLNTFLANAIRED